MANTFATITPAILTVRRALEILTTRHPIVSKIARKFESTPIFLGQILEATVPGLYTAVDWNQAVGLATADSSTEKYPVTIDQFKQVGLNLSMLEASSRPDAGVAIEEHAENLAIAVADAFFAHIFSKVTLAAVPLEVVLDPATLDRTSLVDVALSLNQTKAPESPRYAILNLVSHAKLEKDSYLGSAMHAGTTDTLRRGVIGDVAGFEVSRYSAVPATDNLTGIAGTPSGIAFAAGVPANIIEVARAAGSGLSGGGNLSITPVTEPVSGLTVLLVESVDTVKLVYHRALLFIFGSAIGNPACIRRLVSEAN